MTDLLKNIDKEKLRILGVPFLQFLEQSGKYHDMLALSKDSLSIASKLPDLMAIFKKYEEQSSSYKEARENFEKRVQIANHEINEGFPFLHNSATLMIYSLLEGTIKRIITEFFKIDGVIQEITELGKVKIEITEYITLDEVERYEYLFQEYEKQKKTKGIRYGVDRFESLLQPVGLNGNIDKDIKRNIYELSQIRNNIIHRGGVADRHLISSCPWLNYKIGDPVNITNELYTMYFNSVHIYMIEIGARIGEIMGQDMSEYLEEVANYKSQKND